MYSYVFFMLMPIPASKSTQNRPKPWFWPIFKKIAVDGAFKIVDAKTKFLPLYGWPGGPGSRQRQHRACSLVWVDLRQVLKGGEMWVVQMWVVQMGEKTKTQDE